MEFRFGNSIGTLSLERRITADFLTAKMAVLQNADRRLRRGLSGFPFGGFPAFGDEMTARCGAEKRDGGGFCDPIQNALVSVGRARIER